MGTREGNKKEKTGRRDTKFKQDMDALADTKEELSLLETTLYQILVLI